MPHHTQICCAPKEGSAIWERTENVAKVKDLYQLSCFPSVSREAWFGLAKGTELPLRWTYLLGTKGGRHFSLLGLNIFKNKIFISLHSAPQSWRSQFSLTFLIFSGLHTCQVRILLPFSAMYILYTCKVLSHHGGNVSPLWLRSHWIQTQRLLPLSKCWIVMRRD